MTKSFQQLSAFNLCAVVLVVALTMTPCNGNLQQNGEKLSSISRDSTGDEENHSEICDPTKQNPCKSPTMQCLWSPLDMLYNCRNDDRSSKRDFLRKKRAKQKSSAHKHTRHVRNLLEEKDELNSEQTQFLRQVRDVNASSINDTSSGSSSTNGSISSGKGSSGNVGPHEDTDTVDDDDDDDNTTASALGLAGSDVDISSLKRQANERIGYLEEGYTLEVPQYSGSMTWDGVSDDDETCKTKAEMAKGLQSAATMESKLRWLEDNEDEICDFKKFFHCTVEEEEEELEMTIGDDGTPVEEETSDIENDPVCRCYESSMAVVRGVCYIPADFGVKSACGNVTAPYPIQPWVGAPPLRPRCTPNSDCKESQYWFGRRCTCRWNAKWNSVTHTCDDASKIVKSVLLLLVSFFIPFLSPHITTYFL